jgi:dihydrofolate reductase
MKSKRFGFNLIVAVDKKNGIAKKGKIPWEHNLPLEVKAFFEKINYRTKKEKVNGLIMGKKTFLGHILTSYSTMRTIAVLTRDKRVFISSNSSLLSRIKEAIVFDSFEKAFSSLSKNERVENIWVCGGSQVYFDGLKHLYCQNVYITRIFKDFGCDVFFPKIDRTLYKRDQDYDKEVQEENGIKYQFQRYKSKRYTF